MIIVDVLGILAIVAAAVLLTGRLRQVRDICRISSDVHQIGAVMVGILGAPEVYSQKIETETDTMIVIASSCKGNVSHPRRRDYEVPRSLTSGGYS